MCSVAFSMFLLGRITQRLLNLDLIIFSDRPVRLWRLLSFEALLFFKAPSLIDKSFPLVIMTWLLPGLLKVRD